MKEKETLETLCSSMNTKQLWDSITFMTNMAPAKKCLSAINEGEKANE